MTAAPEPLLRTLAPALRELERRLHAWLNTKHRYPLTTLQRATLEGLADDLHRQAEALQLDRPNLVIMLMGGTGVGKSTLLNALAGGAIAHASFARPTTRDPVVYYHQSIQPGKLDPALQFCKLASHDRPALEQKILVDTPDIDSNDLANREKLIRLLPVADIVLYVGSQEKYHDKLGWELFLEQRRRRAFAFVLNKWDRCVHPGALGLRPDEDLLRDLQAEGFENPLLFRTNARHWVENEGRKGRDEGTEARGEGKEKSDGNSSSLAPPPAPLTEPIAPPPAPLPDSPLAPPPRGGAVSRTVCWLEMGLEQFLELARGVEMGLTRLEVEAIKARGVSQLLRHLKESMQSICPPDLTEAAERVRGAWSRLLADEAEAAGTILLNTLDPYQKEVEHHFASERQKHFSGLMGWYLHIFNKLRYTGSALRDQIPFALRGTSMVRAPQEWDLARFTESCSAAASEQHLHSRLKAMSNRLLVEADTLGMPLGLLNEPTESLTRLDWKGRYAQAMIEVITHVERSWSQPTGARWWLQKGIILLADWVPLLALGTTGTLLLWGYTMKEPRDRFEWTDLVLPLVVVGLTLVVMHVMIAVLLPLRWPAIRAQFHEQLRKRLQEELEMHFNQIPVDITREVLSERRQIESFLGEIQEVAAWLEQREQAASIVNLYGR